MLLGGERCKLKRSTRNNHTVDRGRELGKVTEEDGVQNVMETLPATMQKGSVY